VIGTNAEEGLARFLEELVEQHKVQPLDEVDAGAQVQPQVQAEARD
jgi:hypothetical protein